MFVYFDHNATTPVRLPAKEAMLTALDMVGNASSVHQAGRAARGVVERARGQIAQLVNAQPAQVIFTSGATEANNTVLKSFANKGLVAVVATEHVSVRHCLDDAQILVLPVLDNGLLDMATAQNLISTHRPVLVSMMRVNNETGVIQDVAALANFCRKLDIKVHCDCVQAAGRIVIDFDGLQVDYLTLSAHKMGGPQGIGALIVRADAPPVILLHGGGQEKRQRAGTENVPAIAAFGVAADLVCADIVNYQTRLQPLRDQLEQTLHNTISGIKIMGQTAPRVANTLCFAVPNISADMQLMALDLAGFCVSSGAACSSGTVKPSHVLQAMGVDETYAKCALRLSMGWTTAEDDVAKFIQTYGALAKGWGLCRS